MSSLLDPTILWIAALDDDDILYVVRPGEAVGQRARRILGSDLKASVYRPPYGVTLDRPTPGPTEVGAMYFDTDLGHPIWWDGTAWVDAEGSPA